MDNGFALTATECRLARRSRSMSYTFLTRTSQQECRGSSLKKAERNTKAEIEELVRGDFHAGIERAGEHRFSRIRM